MLLTANILLEKRAVLSWLFDPLFSASRVFDFDSVKQSIAGSLDAIRRSAAGCVEYVLDTIANTQAWLTRTRIESGPSQPGLPKDATKSGARVT
jgi:hypothetical protein